MNIVNYIHKFEIDGQEIELTINCKDDYWTCDITKGETGVGKSMGGKYYNLEHYIKDMEQEHRYAYNFFNKGYKYAKENIV